MAYRIVTGTVESMTDIINGTYTFPAFGELPLGGLTLIFSVPAFTVTFPGAAGAMVSVQAAVSAINTAAGSTIAALRSYSAGPAVTNRAGDNKVIPQGIIAIQKDTGFTILKTGTSNALLSLSTSVDTSSTGIIAQAKLAGFTQGPQPGQLCLIIAP